MPEPFLDECYNGNKYMYLTSYLRIKTKVGFVKTNDGRIVLKGYKWDSFAKTNIGGDVQVLHFIQEGDDSFYVTGYDHRGREYGGYDGALGRPSRFKSKVRANENMTQVILKTCVELFKLS